MRANAIANRQTLSHAEWLELRRHGIGGSDAPTIMGVNPYDSPFSLWREKVGQLSDEEISQREEANASAKDRGNRLEPVIAEWWADTTGHTVRKVNAVLQHPDLDWCLGNIDREIVGHEDGPGILECKNPGWRVVRQWDGDYPAGYYAQVQHYLAVTGRGWGALAMLVDGEFVWHRLDRDEPYIDVLLEREREFWRLVETRTPPEVDGHPATTDALAAAYADPDPGRVVELPDEARGLLKDRARAKADAKAAETDAKAAENRLKQMLGDAEIGLLDGTPAFRWTPVTSRRFDGKRFAAEHPDLDEEYRSESTYRRIHVPAGVVDDE